MCKCEIISKHFEQMTKCYIIYFSEVGYYGRTEWVITERRILLDAYEKLFAALNQGGIETICQTAYDLLKRPVLINNNELKRIGQFPDKEIGDPIWDGFLSSDMLSPQIIWRIREEKLMKISEEADVPVWLDWGLVAELPRIVCTVKIKNSILGYVTVFCADAQYKESDLEITRILSQVVAQELQKNHQPISNNYPTIILTFINALFQNLVRNEDTLAGWEKSMQFKLKPPFGIVVVGNEERTGMTIHYLKSLFIDNRSIYGTVLNGKLYLLFTEVDMQKNLWELMNAQQLKSRDCIDKYELTFGVSEQFDNLLKLNTYKYQAERALVLGENCRAKERIHYYKDLILEDMISCLQNHPNGANFIHPAIEILAKYDEINSTEHLKTLNIYITFMRSNSRTVAEMHIHRNTLFYRLKKIQEITGISLDDEKLCAILLNNFYLLRQEEAFPGTNESGRL